MSVKKTKTRPLCHSASYSPDHIGLCPGVSRRVAGQGIALSHYFTAESHHGSLCERKVMAEVVTCCWTRPQKPATLAKLPSCVTLCPLTFGWSVICPHYIDYFFSTSYSCKLKINRSLPRVIISEVWWSHWDRLGQVLGGKYCNLK